MKKSLKILFLLNFYIICFLFLQKINSEDQKKYTLFYLEEKWNKKLPMTHEEINFLHSAKSLFCMQTGSFANAYWIIISLSSFIIPQIQYILKPTIQKLVLSYAYKKKIQRVPKQYRLKNIIGYTHIKKNCLKIIKKLKDQKKSKIYAINEGILFFGPPGTGKTTFANMIACEAGIPIITILNKDLINDAGKTTIQLDILFETLQNYIRKNGPCILLLDELDFLVGNRSNSLNQESKILLQGLLEKTESLNIKGLQIIGCTNDKESLDSALLRAGRLGEHIEINLPSDDDLILFCEKYNVSNISSVNFDILRGKSIPEIIKIISQ